PPAGANPAKHNPAERGKPTKFQIACMPLPYSRFPLARALSGFKDAGYKYVAWGTTHVETDGGKPVPVLANDAPPEKAKELAKRCRDLGLEPLMMFSMVYPAAQNRLEVLTNRLKQAAAAGAPLVVTRRHNVVGSTKL